MSSESPVKAKIPAARLLTLLTDALLIAACLWQFQVVGAAMLARYDLPWDLEWMEGGTLISALRVMQGQPIHGEPSLEYIPFIYPPLYAWVVGLLGHVFPFGYALARGVSIASFAAACLALVYGARQAGARWPLAIGCAALFTGTWDDCGTFYDLVRVDSLTVALLGWALVLGPGAAPGRQVAAGLLLAGAFASKHNAALFGLPMLIGIAGLHGRAAAIRFAAASVAPALAFLIHQEIVTGGQFLDWILGVPGMHGVKADRLITGASFFDDQGRFTGKFGAHGAQLEMWEVLPITCSLALLFPGWLWRAPTARYWGGVALAGAVMGSLMRGHIGGFVNVLIPMYWIVSLWPALLAPLLSATAPDSAAPAQAAQPRAGWTPPRIARAAVAALSLIGVLALLSQGSPARLSPLQQKFLAGFSVGALSALSLAPGAAVLAPAALNLAAALQIQQGQGSVARYLPSPRDAADAAAFIEELRALPDPVLSPYAPYALVQAGKDPTFSLICLWDIDYKGGPYYRFAQRVEDSLQERRWAAIVVPNDKLGYGLLKHYGKDRNFSHLPPDTVVGWEVQLRQIWVPLSTRDSNP